MLVGGFPGEWEGEHPLEAIRRTGARDVFLAGWHDHAELPDFLAASDVVVLPSVREQFGQVLVEGGACGLPAIAVDAHGPAEIVRDGETGWLVPPDDRDALAAALVEAVNDPEERRRRGERALRGRAREVLLARAGRAGGRRLRRPRSAESALPAGVAAELLGVVLGDAQLAQLQRRLLELAQDAGAEAAQRRLAVAPPPPLPAERGKPARRQARRSAQKLPGAGAASRPRPIRRTAARPEMSTGSAVATFASSVRKAASGSRSWANVTRKPWPARA